MSEITPIAAVVGTTPPVPKLKKPRVLKPKARPGPGSFRYGPQPTGSATAAPAYGPCSFHVDIDSRSALGDASEVELIRAFCNGFADFPDICSVKGYGIAKGTHNQRERDDICAYRQWRPMLSMVSVQCGYVSNLTTSLENSQIGLFKTSGKYVLRVP